MNMLALLILAQDAAPAAPPADPAGQPWWAVLLDSAFGLAILFIFLTAVIGVLINQRRKDKCLKLLHDYHATYIDITGKVIWGDTIVYSQGLEFTFDRPYRTLRGVIKNSALVYQNQLESCLAICRTVEGLTADERDAREKQIRQTFNPNFLRRWKRWIRNMLNTLKDAFNKALSALIGQLSKRPGAGPVLTQQQAGVTQIGTTLLGAAGNAYEPILERHIGKPVVLQLQSPADPDKKLIDLPGYLVDYTEQWLAVFNVDHTPVSDQRLTVTESIEQPGFKVTVDGPRVKVTCTGPEVVVVQSVKTDKRYAEPNVAITNGGSCAFKRNDSPSVELHILRTRQIDIVAPRKQAVVYFGSCEDDEDCTRQHGVAPEPLVEELSDDPVKTPTP